MATRKTQIADRARGDGQAKSVSNLEIKTHHLDENYRILTHNLVRGETGLLKVFTLIPQSPGKPRFEARLDDGRPGKRRDPELDVDIKDVTSAVERDFKTGRNGYVGHHTDRSADASRRIFEVEIATPAGRVFAGDVSFNVAFSVEISISVGTTVSANATVVRASLFRRIRNNILLLRSRLFR